MTAVVSAAVDVRLIAKETGRTRARNSTRPPEARTSWYGKVSALVIVTEIEIGTNPLGDGGATATAIICAAGSIIAARAVAAGAARNMIGRLWPPSRRA